MDIINKIKIIEDEIDSKKDISNNFQIKSDIQNIILSSDEIRKSEAIAEGFSILINKIENLEKINVLQESKLKKNTEELEKLELQNYSLKKEFKLLEENFFYKNKELIELKNYLDFNRDKIINFEKFLIETQMKDSQILTLKTENNSLREKLSTSKVINDNQMIIEEENKKLKNQLESFKYIITNKINNNLSKDDPNILFDEEIEINKYILESPKYENKEKINYKEDNKALFNLKDISDQIKNTENRIQILNEEFNNLDIPLGLKDSNINLSSKISKAKEIMDMIENETMFLINLKCIFNQLLDKSEY